MDLQLTNQGVVVLAACNEAGVQFMDGSQVMHA